MVRFSCAASDLFDPTILRNETLAITRYPLVKWNRFVLFYKGTRLHDWCEEGLMIYDLVYF